MDKKIKRYYLPEYSEYVEFGEMGEALDGEWVKYSDYVNLEAELKAEKENSAFWRGELEKTNQGGGW